MKDVMNGDEDKKRSDANKRQGQQTKVGRGYRITDDGPETTRLTKNITSKATLTEQRIIK